MVGFWNCRSQLGSARPHHLLCSYKTYKPRAWVFRPWGNGFTPCLCQVTIFLPQAPDPIHQLIPLPLKFTSPGDWHILKHKAKNHRIHCPEINYAIQWLLRSYAYSSHKSLPSRYHVITIFAASVTHICAKWHSCSWHFETPHFC